VHEVAARDRAKLPRREESGDRDVAECAPHRANVMVRLAEESLTAAVARKEQRAGSRRSSSSIARRSSRADSASRTWNCTVCPTSAMSLIEIAPVSRSMPTRLRITKSPRPSSGLSSVVAWPT
jgi:hypothetical protein